MHINDDDQNEASLDEVPSEVFCYRDDGDLMRALGCLTFEAAHFEGAIDAAYAVVTGRMPTDAKLNGTAPGSLTDKIKFCSNVLGLGIIDCPNRTEMIECLARAKGLVKDRNVAIHGRLYQLFDGPLMRAATKHSGHARTSPAEIYELASALRLHSALLTFLATYCTRS